MCREQVPKDPSSSLSYQVERPSEGSESLRATLTACVEAAMSSRGWGKGGFATLAKEEGGAHIVRCLGVKLSDGNKSPIHKEEGKESKEDSYSKSGGGFFGRLVGKGGGSESGTEEKETKTSRNTAREKDDGEGGVEKEERVDEKGKGRGEQGREISILNPKPVGRRDGCKDGDDVKTDKKMDEDEMDDEVEMDEEVDEIAEAVE